MKNDVELILEKRGFTVNTLAKAIGTDETIINDIINEQDIDEKIAEIIQPKVFCLAHGFGFESPKDRLEEVIEELQTKYGLTKEQLYYYADVDEVEFKKFMNNELIDRDSKVRIYSYMASLYYVLK
ncbi:hypothetical protein RD055328_11740 [Companilactobacillus sp. RD055328]|uniref:HTH domain-containing protein n=1 Tax=Companilactobacillus sp. RD055328 TaxID=2916634 RepID=UPI001FC86CA5|nr:HTH domain-containing protein [Companilactobacillus sp. RD055328]GKQ43251.1 hypothetical protein RD055328_11740 [Companilactobacillus sp. RD055328]